MACECVPEWTAVLNTMPIDPHKLTVRGRAICIDGSADPELRKAKPQGINPTELILDLVWKDVAESTGQPIDVEYTESPSPEYTSVRIQNCDIVIPVEVVT